MAVSYPKELSKCSNEEIYLALLEHVKKLAEQKAVQDTAKKEKKKLYYEFGHNAFEPGFNADAARAQKQYGYENFGSDNSQNGYREYHFNGSGGDDIFGDLFGNMFRRGA